MSVDLTTSYLNLNLTSPLVVSACPLTGELDVLERLVELGAGAAVMPSLFEEQLEQERPGGGLLETANYFRELKEYNRGPEVYLTHLTAAKKAVSIPIIGSLNVTSVGPSIEYATRIEAAGADALELNVYFLPTDFETSGQEVEARYVNIVSAVRRKISIPLAVKVGPFFTSFPHIARQLVEAGADGLILFNRFLQPEIDLAAMRATPKLALSTPDELRLAMRWIALLYGRMPAVSLAATGGAHSAADVVKLLLAGADVVMVASTLYLHGLEELGRLNDGLRHWLESNDYGSVGSIRGTLSHHNCTDPAAYERANYTKALSSFLNDTSATEL
jgi:dihydroorotate dehydrogenase (fumarate)